VLKSASNLRTNPHVFRAYLARGTIWVRRKSYAWLMRLTAFHTHECE
jgi:hypothetical protein